MKIHFADTETRLRKVAPVLCQLRPQYSEQELIDRIHYQRQTQGYRVVYLEREDEVISVAGYVINEKLHWGKALYIDDLVTADGHRGEGAGSDLLDWLKDYARELGCGQLHLDSGVQRLDAHRFYEREGLSKTSYHYALTELDAD